METAAINMITCRRCHRRTASATYCSFCGGKLDSPRRPKSRGNGTGSVFQRPNKTWTAMITVGYYVDDSGAVKRTTRSKSGFRTKKEALEYLPKLSADTPAEKKKTITWQELYNAWEPTHRAGKSTMTCYHAAMKYFRPIYAQKLENITIDDLQECVDDCPKGRRTKENMRSLAGLMYKYAIPRHLCTLNLAQYLHVSGERGSKDGLPLSALEKLAKLSGKDPIADYIICQCYLGFRPAELLALNVESYNPIERAFVGGAKTEAGKNRTVTVSPKIQPIIDRLIGSRTSGPVFPSPEGDRMSVFRYRDLFYKTLDAAGVENPVREVDGQQLRTYTPHSCRHTFATLMKRVDGADKDKLSLIGHTSDTMLRHYQDVNFDDLRKITDAL